MRLDEIFGSDGGKGASQAYWNARTKLRAAWREVFDEDLDGEGSRAMEAFENALENAKRRLLKDKAGEKRLRQALDIEPDEEIRSALLENADLDDLSPKRVKAAMLDECHRRGRGRHDLRAFLRVVLDGLYNVKTMRRPNVGANRHWPRLRQYLRELEYETDWSPDGRGVRLANIGGGGRVAREPADPSRLSIIIDPDFF